MKIKLLLSTNLQRQILPVEILLHSLKIFAVEEKLHYIEVEVEATRPL